MAAIAVMRLQLLFGALFFISSFQGYAENESVVIDIYQTGHGDKSTSVRRSPMRIPIDVYYDEDIHRIAVIGDESIDAEVYLLDAEGIIVFHSASLNTNYTFSTPGTYTIQIQGDGWYAEGEIEV